MQEIYKDIVGYEGLYQVSNLGNVKSLKYGKERTLKPGLSKVGYLTVSLYYNISKKTYTIHKLVAITFIENPNNKNQVNHINGIKTDNRIENLEWLTQKENIQHAFKTGLYKSKKGEKNSQSKLTNEQVLAIRKDTRTKKEIAKYYNVKYDAINKIKNRRTWNHI